MSLRLLPALGSLRYPVEVAVAVHQAQQ
uniref:Trafficking kinesin protein 2 n=1 Tax=Myotis myotis TaxID=51298 RepID=A0A7J7WJN5_MYOMY|nr:trafficking kinesin protein 2 [Myotis myotis]